MRRFLIKLLFILPLFLSVAGINYFEDPANIFHPEYEAGIAKYLAAGMNVTNVVNYDERRLQRLFIRQMSACPEEIALGSSKIMEIGRSVTKSAVFINSGVSGASLEDHMAIYYLYEQKGCSIKKVLLGIDPWLFNENNGQIRWKALGHEYNALLQKIGSPYMHSGLAESLPDLDKLGELASFSYFRTAVAYMYHGISKAYMPTHNAVNDGFTRLTDGSISYDKVYRNPSPEKVAADAQDKIAGGALYSLENFDRLSPVTQENFERFITYLQSKDITVEFFLCPLHPKIYSHVKAYNTYPMLFKEEQYVVTFAGQHHIRVHGSYDPAIYGLTDADFLDANHCKQAAVSRILNGTGTAAGNPAPVN